MQSSLYALAAALGDTLTANAGTIVVAAFATLLGSTVSYALGERHAASRIAPTIRRSRTAAPSGPAAAPSGPEGAPSAVHGATSGQEPATSGAPADPPSVRPATTAPEPAAGAHPVAVPPPSVRAGGFAADGGGHAAADGDPSVRPTFSAYDLRLRERAFLVHLAARTGRDLDMWMRRIGEQRSMGADRNAVINWLITEGFEFCWASWLERIHANGGQPIYDHAGGPEEPRRGFTFLPDRQAFRMFAGFLRDLAGGRHALCEAGEPDAPRAILDLLGDRERCIDWMTQDEMHDLYLAWCRFAGYVPVERVALMAQAGEALGATKKRFFTTAGQMARLVARHAGRSLPERPTVVRVWSWQEVTARARARDDTARRVTTWADDAWTGADGRKAKPRKQQLKPADSGGREAARQVAYG